MFEKLLLTQIRLGFLRVAFSGEGSIWLPPLFLPPLHPSYCKKNLTNINITLYNC